MSDKFLRMPVVNEITGLARSTIYLLISQDRFPRPISLGDRAVGWLESELHEWQQQRIDASRGKGSSDTRSVDRCSDSEGWAKP